MRNITVDESSVMEEYFRIVAQEGLIKVTASTKQEIMDRVKSLTQGNPQQSSIVQTVNTKLVLVPDVANYKPQMEKAVTEVLGGFGITYTPVVGVKDVAKGVSAPATTTPEAPRGEVTAPVTPQSLNVPTPTTSREAPNPALTPGRAVTSSDKLYDVLKETGKDLIDSAHPGGAKVDGDLVETVVEQQEADLAVVNKVPKGVYATVTSLCEALNKLGYSRATEKLQKVAAKLATPQGVLSYRLEKLATELETRGLKKKAEGEEDITADPTKKKVTGPVIESVEGSSAQIHEALVQTLKFKINTMLLTFFAPTGGGGVMRGLKSGLNALTSFEQIKEWLYTTYKKNSGYTAEVADTKIQSVFKEKQVAQLIKAWQAKLLEEKQASRPGTIGNSQSAPATSPTGEAPAEPAKKEEKSWQQQVKEDLIQVQTMLGLTADGVFGPKTRAKAAEKIHPGDNKPLYQEGMTARQLLLRTIDWKKQEGKVNKNIKVIDSDSTLDVSSNDVAGLFAVYLNKRSDISSSAKNSNNIKTHIQQAAQQLLTRLNTNPQYVKDLSKLTPAQLNEWLGKRVNYIVSSWSAADLEKMTK